MPDREPRRLRDRVYHYRAGDVVPRDATGIVVDGSVAKLNCIFSDPVHMSVHRELEWVEFQEGVRVIRDAALFYCRKLKRVGWSSSITTIGTQAFEWAALEMLNLPEGLRWIGAQAFICCRQLKRVTVPSSVVGIMPEAFAYCHSLEAVTLTGGMVLVGSDAFSHCPRLVRIATSSAAIVVEGGKNARVEAATAGEIEPSRLARLILASRYLTSMKPTDVAIVADAINQRIEGGTGLLNLEKEGVAWGMRARFLRLLSAHQRAVASILEHAIRRYGTYLPRETRGVILSFLGDV